MEYKLELPWPPSLNSYKKIGAIVKTKSGKLYQKRKDTLQTKKFYFDTYILYKQNKCPEWLKFASCDTISFEVYIDLHPPVKIAGKRWDLDNRLKVTLDAIVRAKVIKDDSQITLLHVQKMDNIENGKVIVRIRGIL